MDSVDVTPGERVLTSNSCSGIFCQHVRSEPEDNQQTLNSNRIFFTSVISFPSEQGDMSRPPSSQTTPQFYRVSERDLTEIELHSVDSINDLHRTHPEHSHKGMRPPRPAYTPSPNGNLFTHDGTAVSRRGHPPSSKWQRRLQDMLTPSSSRAYAMGCAIVTLLLLTVLLIFYFLVQQGSAIRMLTEAVREKEASANKLMLLIQELQELRRNMTAMRTT